MFITKCFFWPQILTVSSFKGIWLLYYTVFSIHQSKKIILLWYRNKNNSFPKNTYPYGIMYGNIMEVYQSDNFGMAKMVRESNKYRRSNEAKQIRSWLKLLLISGHDNTKMDKMLPMERNKGNAITIGKMFVFWYNNTT